LRRVCRDRLFDALPQSGRNPDLVRIEITDQLVDFSLNDSLSMHPPIRLSEDLVGGNDFADSMLGQLALDQGNELIRRERVQLDALSLRRENLDLFLGRAVSAQRCRSLGWRGDVNILSLQPSDVSKAQAEIDRLNFRS